MPLRFLSPIHKASRQIGLFLGPRMADFGAANSEAHLLSYLRVYGSCPVGRVRAVFGHKGSTLTGLLDRMERKGWITRELDPEDRRSFRLVLTKKGRRTGFRVQKHLDDLESRLQSRVTRADMHGFRNVMLAIEEITATDLQTEKEHNV